MVKNIDFSVYETAHPVKNIMNNLSCTEYVNDKTPSKCLIGEEKKNNNNNAAIIERHMVPVVSL